MTQMDDEPHPECELYVEDNATKIMIGEIHHMLETIFLDVGCLYSVRRRISWKRAADNGFAKKISEAHMRFLDGDNADAVRCVLLPGGDAPERVVFASVRAQSGATYGRGLGATCHGSLTPATKQ